MNMQSEDIVARIDAHESALDQILKITPAIESLRVPLLQWRNETLHMLQQGLGPKIAEEFNVICASLHEGGASKILSCIVDARNFFGFLKSDFQSHPEKYRMDTPQNRTFSLNGPYPNTLKEVREELDYWASRQNEGCPGSIWEEGIKNRIEHLLRLENRLSNSPAPVRSAVSAWFFGIVLLVFFMALVIWNPKDLAPTQISIVRLLGSILGGIISAFFSGSLQLGGKVPGLDDVRIAAIGGFAAFVLIFLFWK